MRRDRYVEPRSIAFDGACALLGALALAAAAWVALFWFPSR